MYLTLVQRFQMSVSTLLATFGFATLLFAIGQEARVLQLPVIILA
jgi:hypothetical protein